MPPANIPNAASNSGRPAATPVSQKPNVPNQPNAPGQPSDLMLQIQRGLSNIAYADVGSTVSPGPRPLSARSGHWTSQKSAANLRVASEFRGKIS
ncbi:hypothetical protein PMI07_003072 [Rhizobium sp. CF080]|uniref:hypothetical protein n=1 Tax=Rhizobium sp. (strain CF080) TaxID=1144310 RepID=UPI000271D727|nr:hypothetical protein [Rhizobium sp. CF080]EUB95294.1 hypothetical protein PMI07_003072 [Rhizobium sp. CF080]